jgi:hypothetical protein
MPKVAGKSFPYTKKGMAAAKVASNADQDRYGRPLNPQATKANTKEVYNPKTRVTTLVNKKTGKTFAVSMPGPKFRPGVKKVGR